jgi:hypothetical protein
MAGLIGMRRDIACAVLGSGLFMAPEPKTKTLDPERTYFEPSENISQLAQNRSVRLLVVTDRADKKVPAAQQTDFVNKMRKANRQVRQFFVEATDKFHHGVRTYTELITAGCVLGKSDEEIAQAVSTLVRRNAEYNDLMRKELKAKAGILAAGRQSVTGSGAAPDGK